MFVKNTAEKTEVRFFWGVQDFDEKNVNPWDSTSLGELILDPNFDGISLESRAYQKSFCKELAQKDFVLPNSVECWFKDFDLWL